MSDFEPQNLQQWYEGWCRDQREPEKARLSQLEFVRDRAGRLFAKDCVEWWGPKGAAGMVSVVGEHVSRSVRLPVYRAKLPHGTLYLRYNWYDWVVTWQGTPVGVPHAETLFDPAAHHSGSCCEGFHDEWCCGPYAADHDRFTACLGDDYSLYVLLWHVARAAQP